MTTSEHGQVYFGDTRIPYRIERSTRRTTVTVAVDPSKGVILKAPTRTTASHLQTVVKTKARWIVQRLLDLRTLGPKPRSREFVSGESCLYLGRHYRLQIIKVPALDRPAATLRVPFLAVRVSSSLAPELRAPVVREALIRWYRARASFHLPRRVAFYVSRTGFSMPPVLIRDQQKRWGSCTRTGQLRFNWRIVMAPLSVLDYVVAHEVCHLRIKDHSAAFWRLFGTILPDYELRRSRLRIEGACYQL